MSNRNKPKPKRWERTRVAGLYRHVPSGRYYARLFVRGKEKWRALKTDVFGVAELRMRKESSQSAQQRQAHAAVETGRATMGQLTEAYLAAVDAREDLKSSSKAARRHATARVRRTWPGFDELEPKDITPTSVVEWTSRLKRDGTAFTPPGATSTLKGNSPTAVNTAIDALRRILDMAVKRGLLYTNPARIELAEGRLKKRIVPKIVQLPKLADFAALFAEVEAGSGAGGWGLEIADFCRFLAYSGFRKGEAAAVQWSHVNWQKSQITAPGTKTDTSLRVLPIFPPLAELLTKIRQRRTLTAPTAVEGVPHLPSADRIFRVSEAQESITRACAKLGLPRLTHHDFRHAFATVAIEVGTDIPTVARWLGHKDGGALAIKTYGHLRDEHSQAAAQKVRWTHASA